MANAGRILILAKGAWEQLTNYVQLDLVTRNGIAYIARRASVGVDPALDVSYTNWMPFGSAAEIATTVSPGLVMPDGTSITVTSTGLIKAVLGINDLTDVDIENPLTNQVLRYNGTSWTAITLGTAADKSTTNAVTEDSTALVESGAVYDEIATVNSSITTLTNSIAPTEDDTNYSKTYYKGDEFYRNGVLYKVTASSVNSSTAINTGSGGNATTASDISTQVSSLAKIEVYDLSSYLSTGWTINSGGYLQAIKYGNLVVITGYGLQAPSTATSLTDQLPTELRVAENTSNPNAPAQNVTDQNSNYQVNFAGAQLRITTPGWTANYKVSCVYQFQLVYIAR